MSEITYRELGEILRDWLEKFNPYHDKIGRFTFSPNGAGGAGSSKVTAEERKRARAALGMDRPKTDEEVTASLKQWEEFVARDNKDVNEREARLDQAIAKRDELLTKWRVTRPGKPPSESHKRALRDATDIINLRQRKFDEAVTIHRNSREHLARLRKEATSRGLRS